VKKKKKKAANQRAAGENINHEKGVKQEMAKKNGGGSEMAWRKWRQSENGVGSSSSASA